MTALDIEANPSAPAEDDDTLAMCRICGHKAHWLGDHLLEEHGVTVDQYLLAHPGAPTGSLKLIERFEALRARNLKRTLPPVETELFRKIMGFKVHVNADVPPEACLPMPDCYREPLLGELRIDLVEVAIAVLKGRYLWLWGPPGTGKDAFIHYVSASLRWPAIIKQMRPGADIEGWFFSRSFNEKGTDWEEGEVLKALRDGYLTESGRRVPYLVLITDFDRATKAQAESVRLVLDSISGRVEGPGGRTYNVLKGTQVVATANTAGGGDTEGRMVSANVIDGSIIDRFQRAFKLHLMEWGDEDPIARRKFPVLVEKCPGIFKQVGDATTALREAIVAKNLYCDFSHRGVEAWLGHAADIVEMTGEVPIDLTARSARAWLDKMPDEETRLQAERLIDPFIKGGQLEAGDRSDASDDPLANFAT